MFSKRFIRKELQDRDLLFLLETTAPDVSDRQRLKEIIENDSDFRTSFLTNEKLLQRLMSDDETLVRLTPIMFFEILLRNAAKKIGERSYTFERAGSLMTVPVLDAKYTTELLHNEEIILYLAHMLSTFTRVESYAYTFRIGPAVWRKIRFNDMDIESLIQFTGVVDDEYRFGLYKRIGDVCLFLMGIFPDFILGEHRYPFSKKRRPALPGRPRLAPGEYEKTGRQFYRMAAEQRNATELELDSVLWKLHAKFTEACKPLAFIAGHYLSHKMDYIF
jgi:hypothetical protein